MNLLAASALAAGELICEFHDGYRRSLLADLTGEPPRVELLLIYEAVKADSAQVLSSRTPGRKPVVARAGSETFHLIQPAGPSVRVTTLTGCTRSKWRGDEEHCTRFTARHAWHFDTAAHLDPDRSLKRQPSGASAGICEPWKLD